MSAERSTAVGAVLRLASDAELGQAAAIARRFIDQHRDHLPAGMVADAQLLVSEIVSNAVRFGRTDVTLLVRTDPPSIGVVVVDDGEPLPSVPQQPPKETATAGRGLLIVDALATAWGITPNQPPPGKAVWFALEAAT